jgi:hypothetical protein
LNRWARAGRIGVDDAVPDVRATSDLDSRLQRCGGNLKIIASIEQPELIAKSLSHLERTAPQPQPPQRPLGARAPPVPSTLR